MNTFGVRKQLATMSFAAPVSQLAWLASLKTGFNDFTEDQKFMRKVGGVVSAAKTSADRSDLRHWYHWS